MYLPEECRHQRHKVVWFGHFVHLTQRGASLYKLYSLIFSLFPVRFIYYSSGQVTSYFESVKRVLFSIRGRPEHLPAHRGERARVGRHLRPQPRASTSGAPGCPGQGGLLRSAHCSLLYMLTYFPSEKLCKVLTDHSN